MTTPEDDRPATPTDDDPAREWWERASGGRRADGGRDRERWERWAAARRARRGRGWGPPGAWSAGGPPWGPGGRVPWQHGRWRGFGCLFGLIFLVILISFVTVIATIMSTILAKVGDRKTTRLNSSHNLISYAVFCLDRKSVV